MMPDSSVVATSFGSFQLNFSSQGLKQIKILGAGEHPTSDDLSPQAADLKNQLEEFFAGRRTSFDVAIDYSDMADFQADVLKMVATIPYGRTRSYEQIARHLGNAKAARAVGRANGANPIPIIIPCHRVIGKKGDLTGYAYGLDMKRKLLQLENPQAYRPQIALFSA